MPPATKPSGCFACPLEHTGAGYVPGSGPSGSPLVFLGEAPGYDEVSIGQPFVGAAGGMHSRILHKNGLTREQYRHENVLRCCPPGFEVHKSWAEAAAGQCSQYRTPGLSQSPVIVALGATAIRAALGLWHYELDKVKVENYHGTVHRLANGQTVVPTYHPSYLQRGAVNLLGVVSFDLQVALEVSQGLWHPDPIETVIDPPLSDFIQYVQGYEDYLGSDPLAWLAVDIETPDKEKGKSEDELTEHDKSYQIDRVNFAYHPDQGWTVPYVDPYIPWIHYLIGLSRRVVGWNFDYDSKRLLVAGCGFHQDVDIYDGMWLAHHLRSNIPLGLGFWAPFYSRHGAWKHLFSTDAGTYAALDGPQELRTVRGVVTDLVAAGQWEYAHRHTNRLLQEVLKPAQLVGIQADRVELDRFEAQLAKELEYRFTRLQEVVPAELRQLTPKDGLTKPPTGEHAKARTTNTRTGEALAGAEDLDPIKLALYSTYARVEQHQVEKPVWSCQACGAIGIQQRHRCADKALTPQVVFGPQVVTRWYWREPFNPDSTPQILGYLKHRKHKPGRDKKTKKDTTDKDTLQRLWATTKDPFYELLLETRSLGKVRGTYAVGVRKRLDADDRFHPTFTLRPSTLRTSAVAPNIQNVVSDRDAKNLANGFRRCIIATPGIPRWAADWTPAQLAEYL